MKFRSPRRPTAKMKAFPKPALVLLLIDLRGNRRRHPGNMRCRIRHEEILADPRDDTRDGRLDAADIPQHAAEAGKGRIVQDMDIPEIRPIGARLGGEFVFCAEIGETADHVVLRFRRRLIDIFPKGAIRRDLRKFEPQDRIDAEAGRQYQVIERQAFAAALDDDLVTGSLELFPRRRQVDEEVFKPDCALDGIHRRVGAAGQKMRNRRPAFGIRQAVKILRAGIDG